MRYQLAANPFIVPKPATTFAGHDPVLRPQSITEYRASVLVHSIERMPISTYATAVSAATGKTVPTLCDTWGDLLGSAAINELTSLFRGTGAKIKVNLDPHYPIYCARVTRTTTHVVVAAMEPVEAQLKASLVAVGLNKPSAPQGKKSIAKKKLRADAGGLLLEALCRDLDSIALGPLAERMASMPLSPKGPKLPVTTWGWSRRKRQLLEAAYRFAGSNPFSMLARAALHEFEGEMDFRPPTWKAFAGAIGLDLLWQLTTRNLPSVRVNSTPAGYRVEFHGVQRAPVYGNYDEARIKALMLLQYQTGRLMLHRGLAKLPSMALQSHFAGLPKVWP